MNPRPPGYEPDELPTALLRDIKLPDGAGDRARTGTVLLPGDFKSPVSTIPPHRRILAWIRISYHRKIVKAFREKAFDESIGKVTKKGAGLREDPGALQ